MHDVSTICHEAEVIQSDAGFGVYTASLRGCTERLRRLRNVIYVAYAHYFTTVSKINKSFFLSTFQEWRSHNLAG